jgi:hypothetical protein
VAIAVVISVGCAPVIDGPIDHQRAIDRDDSARIAAQLAHLPGVVTADVVLRRAMRDPLALAPPSPAAFSAVLTVDGHAEPPVIRAATERLARAALPELPGAPLAIEIHAGAPRATVARVGPFLVEASSRAPLKAVLAAGCLAIAALAGALARTAWRHRLGNSAQ